MRGVNCFILVVHVRSSFDAFTALSAIRSAELRSLDDRKQRIVGDHSCVLEDRHDRIYIYIYIAQLARTSWLYSTKLLLPIAAIKVQFIASPPAVNSSPIVWLNCLYVTFYRPKPRPPPLKTLDYPYFQLVKRPGN